jgi:hypothetical protein
VHRVIGRTARAERRQRLLGYGRATQPGNTSVLPGNYPLNLTIVLTAVWMIAGAWALHGLARSRRRHL